MTTAKESLIQLSFNDGIVEDVAEDVAGGIITVSENTRFTKLKGTLCKAPRINSILTVGALECGGLISNGRDSTVSYFRAGEAVTSRWSGGTLGYAKGLDGTNGQNAYYPYPLTEAGAVPGGLTTQDAVVCVDASGRTWHFAVRSYNTTQWGLYVTVLDGDRVAVSPRFITTVAVQRAWIGATSNTLPLGAGVAVWYHETGTTLRSRFLTVDTDGSSLVVGAAQTQAALFGGREYADVVSNGTDEFAYLLYQSSSTGLTVLRINLQLNTSASAAIASVITAGVQAHLALCLHTRSGVEYLTAAYSDHVNFTGLRHYTASNLTMIWQRNNQLNHGRIGVQPFVQGANAYMVVALDSFFTGALGTGSTRTTFAMFDMAAGTLTAAPVAYWYKLQSRGGYRKVSDTAIYPYFPCFPSNQTDRIFDGSTGYVTDPSIEVFTLLDTTTVTPVMRCAVDKALQIFTYERQMASSGAFVRNNKLHVAYLEQRAVDAPVGATTGWPTRYATFDLAPAIQPSYAFDERGSAFIASGLPAYWDGTETAEYCPLHRPYLEVTTTGGTGPTNLTGTYSFTAVATWRDANGLIRRSAPALPVTVALAGTKPQVYVTNRASMRNGSRQEEYDIVVYATLVGGSTFLAQSYTPTSKASNGCWYFQAVAEPNSQNVRLYSTGADNEPLTPEAPPPSAACAVVGQRLWIIDAENPYRILPSLLKESDVAYEFNGALAMLLPATYGKALAVADQGGRPLIFCERGVLSISGYGPDNAGQGSVFNEPDLVLLRGCRNRESVIQLPGVGVMFQADDGRFALLGGQVKSFDTFGVYNVGSPLVFQRENEVAYPLRTGTLGWIVYNWSNDSWSKWTTSIGGARPTALVTTSTVDGETAALLYAASTGSFGTLDSQTETMEPMRCERGWISPETAQGDCVFREAWVQNLNAGTHGILVSVFFDYDESSNAIQQSWSPEELADLDVYGRYTLGVKLGGTPARAVKIRIEEIGISGEGGGAGAGMRPLGVEIIYGASPGPRRRSLKEGALK